LTFFAAATNSTLNDVEPGALGFLVVAGIGVVLVFLLRSMNKHLKKIPPPPEEPEEPGEPDQAGDQDQAGGRETSAAAGTTTEVTPPLK
jgi:hypothetical protein